MLTGLLNEETTQAMFMCGCRGWFFLLTPIQLLLTISPVIHGLARTAT
jgi:hypothetical protein